MVSCLLAITTVAVLTGLVTPNAFAATATVEYSPGVDGGPTPTSASEQLTVLDAGSETNSITASSDARGRDLLIRDTSASLTAGRGCQQLDANRVRCVLSAPVVYSTTFEAGGGADSLDLRLVSGASASGGPGADMILLPLGGGFADPGPGPDTVIGGPANDTLQDGGPADSDTYEAGGGSNRIFYARDDGVTIDLGAGTAGAPGERDRLTGFREAYGSQGDDVMRGTEGLDVLDGRHGTDHIDGLGGDDRLDGGTAPKGSHDTIVGGEGDDRLDAAPIGHGDLSGGPGDDIIIGGEGPDKVSGGPGDDLIQTGTGRDVVVAGAGDDIVSSYGRLAQLICGPGKDAVGSIFPLIRPPRDCERMQVDDAVYSTRSVRVGRRSAALRLYCLRAARLGCTGKVIVRVGSSRLRKVGSVRYRLRRGSSRRLRVPLRQSALRRYRRNGSLTLRMLVTDTRAEAGGFRHDRFVEWSVLARR